LLLLGAAGEDVEDSRREKQNTPDVGGAEQGKVLRCSEEGGKAAFGGQAARNKGQEEK
jgi:hypothetical protein